MRVPFWWYSGYKNQIFTQDTSSLIRLYDGGKYCGDKTLCFPPFSLPPPALVLFSQSLRVEVVVLNSSTRNNALESATITDTSRWRTRDYFSNSATALQYHDGEHRHASLMVTITPVNLRTHPIPPLYEQQGIARLHHDNQLHPARGFLLRTSSDLFDPDSDGERPVRRPNVRFQMDDEESFGPSPPATPSPNPSPSPTPAPPASSHRRSHGAGTPRAGPGSATHERTSRSHRAPAGTRKSSAVDIWTFYSEMQQKNHCIFCR
ncbi:hypothetical protein C8J57DRAFT_1252332 [Mycena rebaudengoi]|nr:hypothetical protein C8J57DRAFT_1252332 [Mycena rebaudengoi]